MASHTTAITETFTCKHCHNSVETNKKRFINCGHSFCINCVEKNASKKCPTCGEVFDEFSDTPPGQLTCHICKDLIGGTKGHLLCCHSFCLCCITEWFQDWPYCPVCKNTSTEIVTEAPETSGPEEEFPPPTLISLDRGIPGGRSGGSFSCECGRRWSSEYAYSDVGQKCSQCRRSVKPAGLKPARKASERSPDARRGAHKNHLCGMCEEIGSDCSQSKYTKKDVDQFCNAFNL